MVESKNVALIFGASGISGWAVTKNLLSYPSETTFSRVIGLTNRPKTLTESGLPRDSRLELYSGIDLKGDLEDVKKQMKVMVPDIEDVTHMYYCAYSNVTAYTEDVMGIRNVNEKMTYNAVHSTDQVCSTLKFLVLQTGTNNYGVAVFQHMDKISWTTPMKENTPRVPSPYGDEIFYYAQVDLIKKAAKGKSWGWCEVRPDQIVGFIPNVTGMTYVEPLALYLSLYRYINGPGASVTFPGAKKNWEYTFTESSQDIITRAEIYLSVVKPEVANGEAFNIADNPTPSSWSMKWPILTEYFGLKGTGPGEKVREDPDVWWYAHQDKYKQMCEKHGLQLREIPPETWTFFKAGFTLLDRNREMSLEKIRKIGFEEEWAIGQGYYTSFDRIAESKIIPPRVAFSGAFQN